MNIVFPEHPQGKVPLPALFASQAEGRKAGIVVCDLRRSVIQVGGETVGDNTAGKIFRKLFVPLDAAVDNEGTVLRQKERKAAEGIPNIRKILEVVQMVFFYIKNNADFWKET